MEFWDDPPWWFRDVVLAILVGSMLVYAQWQLDHRAADREERRENLRFVREQSGPAMRPRPFAGIDLESQDMHGLQLAGANFSEANLHKADFRGADLTDANFFETDLSEARFETADLTGASFERADLRGAILVLVKLEGASFLGACWDESTVWEDASEHPADEGACS